MHPYEIKILEYMQQVATRSLPVDANFFDPIRRDMEHYYRKMVEDDYSRGFSIRMSSIGRPLCQQQMEKAQADAVEDEANHPLRMLFGGVVEAITVSTVRNAGINIEEEQTAVSLPMAGITVSGTLDLVIDGAVWDVKSASPHAFMTKFASYQALKADDPFGYILQLYGYAKARGVKPGGWLIMDKSSGILKVMPVPEDYHQDMDNSLATMERNVTALLNNEAFMRCFNDVPETFKKRPTGNRVLVPPCSYCKFKYSCWPGLQHLPQVESKSFDPPYKYYTEMQ